MFYKARISTSEVEKIATKKSAVLSPPTAESGGNVPDRAVTPSGEKSPQFEEERGERKENIVEETSI